MTSGYTGAGFKTVLPSKASAKVSFRLVGSQDPQAVLAAMRAHVAARVPADCTVEILDANGAPATVRGGGAAMALVDLDPTLPSADRADAILATLAAALVQTGRFALQKHLKSAGLTTAGATFAAALRPRPKAARRLSR